MDRNFGKYVKFTQDDIDAYLGDCERFIGKVYHTIKAL